MPETNKQMDAFEAYYALGSDRSLVRLHQGWANFAPKWAAKSPSLRTLKNWSKWYSWQNRIIIRDREVQAGLEKKVIPELIAERARLIKGLKDLQQIALAGIQSAFARDPKTGALKKDEKGNPILLVSVKNMHDLRDLAELGVRLTEAELKALGEPERIEARVIEVKYDENIEREKSRSV